MERGSSSSGSVNQMAKGLLPAITPVVLIMIGYIDPGKWATCIDVGARFGGDLVAFALLFNFVGVLCHYLSARITVITGRNLTQICTQEYDKLTCIFLGVQAEVSVICLDLTMIIGMAHGLNIVFGLDLFTGLLLTALNSVLYPLFSTFLESSKVKVLVVCLAGLTIVYYVLGMLSSLSEFPASSSSLVSKLSGESAFALMGLLGSSVMPHNFYLHSSIVQRYQGPASVSKSAWSQDNFILNFAISSGIFLVNYVLMNSAANAFYSTGLGLLSFQDAISLLDQAYRNSIIPFASFVVLFLANQIVASSWEFCAEGAEGGETMLHEFFNMDLPQWLHRATIRIFAVVAALFCLWLSGAEGMYHLLICSQVMVALLLPSSVIPLFRIASCRPIMGLHKISPVLEFIVLLTFMGMLGLELTFVVEMIFGESDWVGNLRWSINNGTSMSYILLLVTVCISFFIILWLASTPLKSVSSRKDSQPFNWGAQQVTPESCTEREKDDFIETRFREEEPTNATKASLPLEERSRHSDHDIPATEHDVNLPDTIMETIEEVSLSKNHDSFPSSSICHPEPEHSSTSAVSVTVSSMAIKDTGDSFPKSSPVVTKQTDAVEKTLRIEGDLQTEKEDDGYTWEPEESSKDVAGVGRTTTADGPGSSRSLSGKGDEGGTGAGSLSRLSGLGRAARRQLALALDEFWGQLYDFHGQLTQGAKDKKLDMLFSLDSKPFPFLPKVDSTFGMQYQSTGGRESDSLTNSSLYDALNQQLENSIESAFRAQQGSTSSWSSQMQLLNNYVQSSNRGPHDVGEKRYQSLHLQPSAESFNYQSSNRSPLETGERRYQSMRTPPSSESFDYKSSNRGPLAVGERRHQSVRIAPSSESLGHQSLNRGPLDAGEKRYQSLRGLSSSGSFDYQPATVHGYQLQPYHNVNERPDYAFGQLESLPQKSPSLIPNNYRESYAFTSGQNSANGVNYLQPSSFQNLAVQRTSGVLQSDKPSYGLSAGPIERMASESNAKKYHSLPDISGRSVPLRNSYMSDRNEQLDSPSTSMGFGAAVGRTAYEQSPYPSTGSSPVGPLAFDELSPSMAYCDAISSNSSLGANSLWSNQAFAKFGLANDNNSLGAQAAGDRSSMMTQELPSVAEMESKLLQSLRHCILKLLKLEGSEWLFRPNDGVDEDLIDRVAARERFVFEVESRDKQQSPQPFDSQYSYFDRKLGANPRSGEATSADLISSVPHCGEGCVWKADLIVSFGVWCIHRVLELSLMESRPELWGKYTYVLNRLQGVIELAFFKPRSSMSPCFCLQIPASYQMRSSPPVANGMLPPASRPSRGKVTTAPVILEIIKDVEIAISCRKGRSGTAAGDVAFPKGKENLASVLKRYKRRLSNRAVAGPSDSGSGSRKL